MTTAEACIVWDMAYAHWPADAVFRYFSRNPRDGSVFGCAVQSPGELAFLTTAADKDGRNSYWQPNPTRKRHGTRCSAADITEWRYFMVDIDPVSADADPHKAASVVRESMGDYPYHWIDSGRGAQLLYPLLPVHHADFEYQGHPWRTAAAKAQSYTLATLPSTDGCIVDTSCSDLARVMRLPYTTNQKTGRLATICWRASHFSATLANRLLDNTPNSLWERPAPSTVAPGSPWAAYLLDLTVAGRRFLTEGAEEPGRHKAAAAAMLSLLEQGASEEQILSALSHGARLCEPPLPQPEVTTMVTRRFR